MRKKMIERERVERSNEKGKKKMEIFRKRE